MGMARPPSHLQLHQRVSVLEHQLSQLMPVAERVKNLECTRSQEMKIFEENLQNQLNREREARLAAEDRLKNEVKKSEALTAELASERHKCQDLEKLCSDLKKREEDGGQYKEKYQCLVSFMKDAPVTNTEKALHAAKCGYDLVLQVLFDMDFDIDTKYEGNLSLLHIAVTAGNLKIVKLLLQRGAHVNAKESSGVTPLHEAAWCGNEDMESPLHYAARKGHIKICEELLNAGAKVNLCDHCNFTPLHEAARGGHLDVLKMLLEHKGDPMLTTNSGHTAYHMACNNNRVEVAEYLATSGFGDAVQAEENI
ncbi:hypothetical protein C0J52_22497 [Blattella germanica]|nr:hypothetical protein C0J52_22497 [Blattella germanica]